MTTPYRLRRPPSKGASDSPAEPVLRRPLDSESLGRRWRLGWLGGGG